MKTASNGNGVANTRYDRRLEEILAHATDVFCEKGYDAASIRDISRATGTSLAGLYYYFPSKEHLLYLIQKDAFETLIGRLEKSLAGVTDPVERVRAFIRNHLAYSVEHRQRMKVLSHEADTLKGPQHAEVADLKRRYYHLALELVEDLRRERRLKRLNSGSREKAPDSRVAVLGLFGMMNWIYTWHRPGVDPSGAALSEQMAGIFLNGILNTVEQNEKETKRDERHRTHPVGKATGRVPRRAGRGRAGNGRPAGQHVHV